MAKVTLLVVRKRFFIVHLSLFLIVMGMLAALNLIFTPNIVWFLYPLFGWGIGVVLHFFFAIAWGRENWKEMANEWKNKILIRLFTIHLVVYLAVSGLLVTINLNHSPQLLWSLFPVAGWGAGILLHLVMALLWAPRPQHPNQREAACDTAAESN